MTKNIKFEMDFFIQFNARVVAVWFTGKVKTDYVISKFSIVYNLFSVESISIYLFYLSSLDNDLVDLYNLFLFMSFIFSGGF